LQFRVANPGNDYIFLNRYREPLTYAGGRQILYEIGKKAGYTPRHIWGGDFMRHIYIGMV